VARALHGTDGAVSETETVLSVRGMTCGNCVRHVEAAVRAVPGVHAVAVDLQRGTVRVSHAPGADVAAIATAIDEAGYQASAPA
jgi:copper ion binding protein